MPKIIHTSDRDLQALDLKKFVGGISPYGEADESVERAFLFGKDYFVQMVEERIGFKGGRVLDLLSGYGRWVPFLSEFNKSVIAIERMETCQTLAKRLCSHFEVQNAEFWTGDVSLIERIEDQSIDYVWMWSGLQYVDRAYTLSQINRVLRPKGRLFVGAYNGPGIMLEHVKKGVENKTLFEGTALWALQGMSTGPDGDGNPNFSDLETCDKMCQRYGFDLIASAPQYCLDLKTPSTDHSKNQLAEYVDGYVRTIEFVAEKKTSLPAPSTNKRKIITKLLNKLSRG